MFEHVFLQVGRRREHGTAQVARETGAPAESVLDQVRLQFERRVEFRSAQSAIVIAALGQQMRGNVRLNFSFGRENLLAFDALIAPRLHARLLLLLLQTKC